MDYLFPALISVVSSLLVCAAFTRWIDRRIARALWPRHARAASAREAKALPPVGEPVPVPPPPPPVSFAPAPGGLPVRAVSVTRDDHPDHTRATVVAPPPEGEVALPSSAMGGQTRKSVRPGDPRAAVHTSDRPPPPVVVLAAEMPPSTARERSRAVGPLDDTLASDGAGPPDSASRAVERDDTEARAEARLAELDAELGPEGKAAVRARVEAAEDERERARGAAATDDDERRDTGEEHTKVWSARAVAEAAKRPPPPHSRPVPLKPVRPTLFGIVGGPIAEPSWVEKRVAALAEHARETGEPFDPEAARRQAEEEGRIAGAPRARRDRDALTPTEPSGPNLDWQIERLWHRKIAAAQEAGKDARHCYGGRCFHEHEAIRVCECNCDGCVLVGELLIAAKREITGRE